MIQNQVKLPVQVAINVVMQGIKIRLGRSVVTISGVVLGIAFLMSILAGQVLKSGVQEEDALRIETERRLNFIANEMGPAAGRTLVVYGLSGWSEVDTRVLARLLSQGLSELRVAGVGAQDARFAANSVARVAGLSAESGEGVSALYFAGSGAMVDFDAAAFFSEARQRAIFFGGESVFAPEMFQGVSLVRLNQSPTEEDLLLQAAEARKNQFRNSWIIIISLLVTVIGITNAMLMSVTERFRDIGTMKCLGALSSFVRQMFLLESAFMGTVGSLLGAVGGVLFSVVAYGITYGFGLISVALAVEWMGLIGWMAVSVVVGIFLSILAAIYPANVASKMVPAVALRTSI